MSTTMFTVCGSWHSVPSSTDPDLKAQPITGTHASFALPVAPEPVRAAPTCTPHDTTDAIDDLLPPPYADPELPAYSADSNTEPITLAMYLFKLGFLFPPFWVLGAVIMISPLTAPVDFEPSKSRAERQQLVQIIRDAELRWARRCAWALVALVVLAGVVAAITLAVLRS